MSDGSNPYTAPQPEGPFGPQDYSGAAFTSPKPVYTTPPPMRSTMAWGESLRYIFQQPNWGMTLLFGTICQFIPIVGPLVFFGYQLEVEVDLTLSQGAGYRPFDFNRFTAYLKRGVFPFLVALLFGLVLVPVFYVLLILGVLATAGLASAAGESGGAVVVIVAAVLGFIAYIALIVVMNLILPPMMLRAGFTQQFGEGFNFAFVRDYARRVRQELILAVFFQMFAGMAIVFAGMLLCFVGIYPAVIVAMLMQAHLQFQIYEIYRARGGEVVPITSVD